MLNNELNLTPEQYQNIAERPEDRDYIIFAHEERRRTGLYHVLYRIVWGRNGESEIMEDHAFHFQDSPWERHQ
jgi:hypothetical protein